MPHPRATAHLAQNQPTYLGTPCSPTCTACVTAHPPLHRPQFRQTGKKRRGEEESNPNGTYEAGGLQRSLHQPLFSRSFQGGAPASASLDRSLASSPSPPCSLRYCREEPSPKMRQLRSAPPASSPGLRRPLHHGSCSSLTNGQAWLFSLRWDLRGIAL